jgi:hypothetical protein
MTTKLGLRILKLVVPTKYSGAFIESFASTTGAARSLAEKAFACERYTLLVVE